MNIFFLDRDPQKAARFLCDVHVVKMVLETTQILSSVLHRHKLPSPYRRTHANHPSVLWAGDSLAHYRWTRRLGLALAAEYRHRRGREHACEAVLRDLPRSPDIPVSGWKDPPLVMPESCRKADAVAAYRLYYVREKLNFPHKGPATWTRRQRPKFLISTQRCV